MKLFAVADSKDREGNANKTVAQTFYMAMILFESLRYFGELDDDVRPRLANVLWTPNT